MKIVSALAVASIALTLDPTSAAENLAGDRESAPWTQMEKGEKTYVTGVRSTPDGNNFCGGALISPSHILTTTSCIAKNIRWASVGSQYYTGIDDGEQIKIVSFIPHPKNAGYENDFLILELEVETDIEPVKLDSAENSVAQRGVLVGRLGWNDTTAEAVQSKYMHSVEMQLISNEQCSEEVTVDDSMVCSRGVQLTDSCLGDHGGPVIAETKKGDILVGLVSSNEACGQKNFPSVYSRVASARPWIDSVIQHVCIA